MGEFSDVNFARPRAGVWSLAILGFQATLLFTLSWPFSAADWALFAISLILPAPHFRVIERLCAARGLKKPEILKLEDLKALMQEHPQQVLLGRGFVFKPRHSRLLRERLIRGLTPAPSGHGSLDLHTLALKNRESVWAKVKDLSAHTLIFGTTGAGKTRLFELLAAQAVLRGDSVVVFDPKGDDGLRDTLKAACALASRSGDFLSVDLLRPDESEAWDPLGSYRSPAEIGDRVSSLMAGDGGAASFKAYANTAVSAAAGALELCGREVTVSAIRDLLSDSDALLNIAKDYFRDFTAERALTEVSVYFERICQKGGPKADALRGFYDWLSGTGLHPRDPRLDLIFTVLRYDKAYYSKISAGAMPILSSLCSGPLARLLSSGKGKSFSEILKGGSVTYVSLGSLNDHTAGSALGRLMLADLASCAGKIYAEGPAPQAPKRVSVFIDEAAELVCESMVQLLNKSRGAGFAVTLATQTVADLEARGGSRALAFQIMGNCNSLISLRVIDAETANAAVAALPETAKTDRSISHGVPERDPHLEGGSRSRSASLSEAALIPPGALAALPDFEYVARLADGRTVKGRLPVLSRAMPPANPRSGLVQGALS